MASNLKDLEKLAEELLGQHGKISQRLAGMKEEEVKIRRQMTDDLLAGKPDSSSHSLRENLSGQEIVIEILADLNQKIQLNNVDLLEARRLAEVSGYLQLEDELFSKFGALETEISQVRKSVSDLLEKSKHARGITHEGVALVTKLGYLGPIDDHFLHAQEMVRAINNLRPVKS